MKRYFAAAAIAGCIAGPLAPALAQDDPAEPAAPDAATTTADATAEPANANANATTESATYPQGMQTLDQRAGYIIGVDMGRNMRQSEMELNIETFLQGLRDGLEDNDLVLTDAQIQETMVAFQQQMVMKQMQAQQERLAQAEGNLAQANEFLAQNKEKEGVSTTDSGLQYQVIKRGPANGLSPDENDRVTVHYTGKLMDGEVFDSSVERGEPATFQLNQVIEGWTEGLQHMHVGDKYRLFVPPALGYGENPRPGGPIQSNHLLIFDVELIDVAKVPGGPAAEDPHAGHDHAQAPPEPASGMTEETEEAAE